MKILVTGGAGFIGANFIFYMLEKYPDYHVVCLDKLSYAGNLDNLTTVKNLPGFKFVKGDITDIPLLNELFESYNFDLVVNFAAESHVDRSISDPYPFIISNILGTQALLDTCLKFKTPRFHQISTDEVYGDLPLDPSAKPFSESANLRPSNPYAASKASADLLTLAYFRTHSLPVTISRSSNNYGPLQHSEKFIPSMISHALNNSPLPIYGDGSNVRDWLFVQDHCSAIDLIIHKGSVGSVYNISANCPLSNLELAKLILNKLNKPLSLISFVPDRAGHDLRYAIDPSRISNDLSWSPSTPFTLGLDITLSFYLNTFSHSSN